MIADLCIVAFVALLFGLGAGFRLGERVYRPSPQIGSLPWVRDEMRRRNRGRRS